MIRERYNLPLPSADDSNLPIWWPVELLPSQTACKHGEMDCERCGTTSRRDTLHGTKNGKGRIARIR